MRKSTTQQVQAARPIILSGYTIPTGTRGRVCRNNKRLSATVARLGGGVKDFVLLKFDGHPSFITIPEDIKLVNTP